MKPATATTFIFLTTIHNVAARLPDLDTSRSKFSRWYPQMRGELSKIVRKNCSLEYDNYVNRPPESDCAESSSVRCWTNRVVDCILTSTTESDKANMASSAVLLGLVPTTLSLAGSSTLETGLLSLRRPFLAFLLATGAPVVSPIRSFEYRNPQELLVRKTKSLSPRRLGRIARSIVLVLQYILATGAIANLVHVSWELSVQTICSFASNTDFLPALWAFIAVAVHALGATAVALRIQLVDDRIAPKSILSRFIRASTREFQLNSHQHHATMSFRQETNTSIFLSWSTSFCTLLHIIFGTMVFSSILFISTEDAVIVVVRYTCSTIICRAVLMFEIRGMRDTVRVQHSERIGFDETQETIHRPIE